jgi:hypothetical protein
MIFPLRIFSFAVQVNLLSQLPLNRSVLGPDLRSVKFRCTRENLERSSDVEYLRAWRSHQQDPARSTVILVSAEGAHSA